MEVWWGSNAVYAGKNKATSFVLLLPCLFHTSLRVHVCVCVGVFVNLHSLFFRALSYTINTKPAFANPVSQSVSLSVDCQLNTVIVTIAWLGVAAASLSSVRL